MSILTSKDEPIRLDPICDTSSGGILYLSFCPGKKQRSNKRGKYSWNRCINSDLDRIKSEYNINYILCLLEDHEFCSLKIYDYFDQIKKRDMEAIHYPVKDKDIPNCMKEFHTHIKLLYNLINDGHKVVVHCAGGVGRSGTIAAGLLCYNGFSPNDSIKLVQERRFNSIKRPSQQVFISHYHRFYC